MSVKRLVLHTRTCSTKVQIKVGDHNCQHLHVKWTNIKHFIPRRRYFLHVLHKGIQQFALPQTLLFVIIVIFTPIITAGGTIFAKDRHKIGYKYSQTSLFRASLIRMPHNPNTVPGSLFYHFLFTMIQYSACFTIRTHFNGHEAVRINEV